VNSRCNVPCTDSIGFSLLYLSFGNSYVIMNIEVFLIPYLIDLGPLGPFIYFIMTYIERNVQN
jgi:hypothetical protein